MRPSFTTAIEALGTPVAERIWFTAASISFFRISGAGADCAQNRRTQGKQDERSKRFQHLASIVRDGLNYCGRNRHAYPKRVYHRLAMGGAALQVVSPLLAQSGGDRKIGYGIIGLGRISMDHFMPGVLASKNSRITGLVSGHRDKALAQAAKYGVPESSIYSYENMDDFKNNPAIDAVYVALPNSMHAEYTIRSAKRGKARAVREADGHDGGGLARR